jgi:peptide-methionine (S)-S-oxide reductase
MVVEKAAFAAGCFWGVEYKFSKVPGVLKTVVGYMGGERENPTYKLVCTGQTGHAECVEVEYDSDKVSFIELFDFFLSIHNPTSLNRQGPDVGTQYRSALFFYSDEHKKIANDRIDELTLSNHYDDFIVTEVLPATIFYPAEDYHQKYLEKKGINSCSI